ncbi:MPT63 family protein [Mycobacterium talmoniae]|nr:MPT63 family protein [Mycobacterium talmoniae]
MKISTAAMAAAATFVTAGALGIASAAIAAADEASDTTASHPLGTQATLTNGDVVQGWTISDLKQSSDTIPYTPQGTLWEANATDEALQGSVTPIVSNLNARSASGQTYRVLYGVATPQGVNPGTISQGQKTTGKVYFDVTGDNPTSVVYNAGGKDLATWVQPAPSSGPSGSAPAASPRPSAPAGNPSTTAPAGNQQTPAGTPGGAAPAGSQGTPIPAGSQGTPLPAGSEQTPAGTPSTPAPAGTQGTQEVPASTPAPAGTQGTQEVPASTPAPAGTQGTQEVPASTPSTQAPAGGAQGAPAGGAQGAPAAAPAAPAPANPGTAPAGNAGTTPQP